MKPLQCTASLNAVCADVHAVVDINCTCQLIITWEHWPDTLE